jgi:hypothetical protein
MPVHGQSQSKRTMPVFCMFKISPHMWVNPEYMSYVEVKGYTSPISNQNIHRKYEVLLFYHFNSCIKTPIIMNILKLFWRNILLFDVQYLCNKLYIRSPVSLLGCIHKTGVCDSIPLTFTDGLGTRVFWISDTCIFITNVAICTILFTINTNDKHCNICLFMKISSPYIQLNTLVT